MITATPVYALSMTFTRDGSTPDLSRVGLSKEEKWPSMAPTAPIISTLTSLVEFVVPVGLARDMRPHATAWFAPLPPALVK